MHLSYMDRPHLMSAADLIFHFSFLLCVKSAFGVGVWRWYLLMRGCIVHNHKVSLWLSSLNYSWSILGWIISKKKKSGLLNWSEVTYLRCWGQSAASLAVSFSSSPPGCRRDQPCPCWFETLTAGCLGSYLALSPKRTEQSEWQINPTMLKIIAEIKTNLVLFPDYIFLIFHAINCK